MSNRDMFKNGQLIKNRYVIEALIAKGGMGTTYLAHDKTLNKKVAVKVVQLSNIEEWKTLELFEREVNTLKNLKHPNIPEYYNYLRMQTKISSREI